jgi:hypothetical protein
MDLEEMAESLRALGAALTGEQTCHLALDARGEAH